MTMLSTPAPFLLLAAAIAASGAAAAQGGTSRRFGTGCPGAAADVWGWAPHPGLGALSIYGPGRVPTAPAVAFLGTSNQRWGALNLPLPLDAIGLAGCTLYTDITVTQPVIANALTEVEARWQVPASPALAGSIVYGQFLGLQDPRVNPAFPLTTSAAVELQIGPIVPFTGLRLVGDPTQPSGAQWFYKGVEAGVPYDLSGRLWRPSGTPPDGGFPGVILNHGGNGSVDTYSSVMAQHMVTWNFVCIGANYTQADRALPLGSPGGFLEKGGYLPNVQRALKCWDILQGLGYVNMGKVAVHGSSNGGFQTVALCAAAPAGRIRVASHVQAGIEDARAPERPSAATAAKVRVPYLVQHGDQDVVVPIQLDVDYVTVLQQNSVAHQFIVWPGLGHELGGPKSPVLGAMLANVRAWFRLHGVF